MWYILKDRVPYPATLEVAGEEMENRRENSIVGKTHIFGVMVSTVFLYIDHDFSKNFYDQELDGYQPLIFETMIFGGKLNGDMYRYRTWEEARAGHWRCVAKVALLSWVARLVVTLAIAAVVVGLFGWAI